ncbi:unnamed protein product [Protopolystoma xenopodis]|uniref:Uncharacterized protein n=1 Tax=Protopolystoma xenopodis TaxID=117903 RepID=A0A448WRU8_9PLAT|nr:unnamed protein product [Protopolystoma xenopodis]
MKLALTEACLALKPHLLTYSMMENERLIRCLVQIPLKWRQRDMRKTTFKGGIVPKRLDAIFNLQAMEECFCSHMSCSEYSDLMHQPCPASGVSFTVQKHVTWMKRGRSSDKVENKLCCRLQGIKFKCLIRICLHSSARASGIL